MTPEAATEPRIVPEKIEPWIGYEIGATLFRNVRNRLATDPAFRARCQRREEELNRRQRDAQKGEE